MKIKTNISKGFTMVELIIVVVIIGILATIGFPSFQSFIANQQLTTTANNLQAFIQVARSESVKKSEYVVICPSADQTSCASSSSWTPSWIMFEDLDKNGDLDTDDKILKVENSIASTIGVTRTGKLVFTSVGTISGGSTSFSLSNNLTSDVRYLCLELSGKSTVSKVACS